MCKPNDFEPMKRFQPPALMRPPPGKSRPNWRRTVALVGAIAVILFPVASTAWLVGSLPDIDQLTTSDLTVGASGPAKAVTSGMSGGARPGAPLVVAELPPYLIQALLATEDRDFFNHIGVDPIAIVRAIIADLRAERLVQGGSTLTEQLAKGLLPSGQPKLLQKLQEMALALWIEHRFTKNEILAFYLERAYFGSGAYGIEAAAHRYFGKPARSVTLWEAAILVSLLPGPSQYNPLANPALATRRAKQVLRNMMDQGFLGEEQARQTAAKHDAQP